MLLNVLRLHTIFFLFSSVKTKHSEEEKKTTSNKQTSTLQSEGKQAEWHYYVHNITHFEFVKRKTFSFSFLFF